VLARDVDRCRASVALRDVVSERLGASRLLRLAFGIAIDDDQPATVAHLKGLTVVFVAARLARVDATFSAAGVAGPRAALDDTGR
jgi:hypothetical protein